jgi:ubiquinone/menaquinone biosynthesis C-methylase UbiE
MEEGDVEVLPFEDDSFGIVLSSFGYMFTPRLKTATKRWLEFVFKIFLKV